MGKWQWALLATGAVGVAGLSFGWGQGLFYPCGSLDSVLHLSNCSVVARWDETIVEALARGSNEGLAAVLRDAEEPADEPQELVVVAPDGEIVVQTTLDTAPDQSWAALHFSADGDFLLAGFHRDIVRLFDRKSGKRVTAFQKTYGADRVSFTPDGEVLVATESDSFDRPVSRIALRFNLDGSADGQANGIDTLPVTSSGIGSALTPDGRLMVQHEKTSKETGIVAMRVIEPQFASWAGSLMVAPITGWMDQILPHIWISPDSAFVAASFDSADEWGKTNSALAVWELESRQLVTLVPTWRARWENVVWLSDGRLAASRYNIDWHDSEIAVIRYFPGDAGD